MLGIFVDRELKLDFLEGLFAFTDNNCSGEVCSANVERYVGDLFVVDIYSALHNKSAGFAF